ncbi:MAG: adenylosuccinate synthase [Phycisphaera sp.]|nr:adenylosuccinate synthase [Phycisphaera sp.]
MTTTPSVNSPTKRESPVAGIDRLTASSGHTAIVGLQWGDEGKGKIVDLLAPHFDLVVRYNGGANAGHSVQVGKERYALHLIPSGILSREKINVLGNGVVIDPNKLLEEIDGLRKRGVHVAGDNLRISDRAHVVLPYHKSQDALMEAAVSHGRSDSNKIGTTGRGIGPCYADKALRSTAVRMGDLLDPRKLEERLAHIVPIKNVTLAALAQSCDQSFEPFDPRKLAEEFAEYGKKLKEHVTDASHLLHESMAHHKRLLFEGANATLLDIDHGTYPYVTSSNCSSLGVHTGTGVPGHKVTSILGVVKAYQTRVGGGPMPTELHDEVGNRIRERGHEYGTTTGRPRRCGHLDLMALKYAARLSGATGICLMLLDVLAGFETLKVCTGYRHNGQTLDHYPGDADVLAAVEPIYQEVPGFGDEITACKNFADLPAKARAYIELIEQHAGVSVKVISVGPARDQTIVR